jgi:hypothetical protein
MLPCEICKNLLRQPKTPQRSPLVDWEDALNLTPKPQLHAKTEKKAVVKQASFWWMIDRRIKDRKCQPKTRGEIKIAAPHVIAIAMYRAGFGYKRICDKLTISRGGNLQGLKRLIIGCGGGDKRRAQCGKRNILASDVKRDARATKSDYWLHGVLEARHDGWWASYSTQPKWKRDHERMIRTPELRVKFYLRKRLRNLVGRRSARGYGLKFIDLVGCSATHLRQHLESQFQAGMAWGGHGPVWHIDHIIPCTYFNLLDPEEAKKCFNWRNLRPLWAGDNIRKGNKILPEFTHLVTLAA